MQKIDAHQHFWHYHPVKDAWITADMAVIQKDFMPEDLLPVLKENTIDGCIAVQASQNEEENIFLTQLATSYPSIKGIVGWVDLQADDIDDKLQLHVLNPFIKGFRHVLQAEPNEFMLAEKFMRGISLLAKYNFTYDILINCGQVRHAEKLVRAFPTQRFVIDHLAKPMITSQVIEGWKQDMEALAQHQNVCCKISGFCTEADWQNWTHQHVAPYFDAVFNAFGPNRVMFGSDWPVNLLAGGYNKTVHCLREYTAGFSAPDQDKFWGGNAADFYNL
ncbi:amidohydrolase [Mucilaginibacter sp. PAMC 26640]|nr:amidohydrolase [Mucilaginibacter sp. PAMC 26640]